MFGRKKWHPPLPDERSDLMWLTVEDADEAWAVLRWALERVPTEPVAYMDSRRAVTFIRAGDWSTVIHADGSNTEYKPSYKVEFPREIWERAKAGYTNAHAERKVREEIFGKGKH